MKLSHNQCPTPLTARRTPHAAHPAPHTRQRTPHTHPRMPHTDSPSVAQLARLSWIAWSSRPASHGTAGPPRTEQAGWPT